ncbi:chaperone protein ClpB1-like protein [Tanacetum coccineum]
MLNPDTFTHLTCHILFVAHEIAKAAGHEELTLLHVVAASISDWNSLFKQAITNVDDEETSNRAEYVFNEALRKLPSQSTTSLDCVPINIHVLVTLRWAQKLQRRTGDTYLAYDHLMLGLLFFNVPKWVQSRFGDEIMGKYRALKTYGRDLVEQASKLGPVIGRDEEIEEVIMILLKKTKNNPLLIGKPGVGKTTVIEGVAQKIFRGDVPSKLADVRIVALDIWALTAGTKFTGEFLEDLETFWKKWQNLMGR